MKTAADIMTKDVISVDAESPLIDAVNLLLEKSFNGLPVTAGSLLVGIITEYDMVTKGSAIHIPTLLKVFGSLDQKNSASLKEELKKVMIMKVKDVMNPDPLTLLPDDTIMRVVDAFTQHHTVNPIPIVDSAKNLVGIISRSDMLKFLGDKSLSLDSNMDSAQVDQNLDKFIQNFEGRFTLVTKGRMRFWLVASLLFALVGFAIAWLLILRVNF